MWTLHGREDALVGFMAIVDAMLAFAKLRGDAIRSIRWGAGGGRSPHCVADPGRACYYPGIFPLMIRVW